MIKNKIEKLELHIKKNCMLWLQIAANLSPKSISQYDKNMIEK